MEFIDFFEKKKKDCLQESPKDLRLRIDIYDEVGIGGGASGVSGGLLHPYSPKGPAFFQLSSYGLQFYFWDFYKFQFCFFTEFIFFPTS